MGESCTGSIEVSISGVESEAPYLLLSVDDNWEVLERHQLNNEAAAETALMVPWLTDGAAQAASFGEHHASHLYRVEVSDGDNLLMTLSDADGLGVNELYARFGAPPTRRSYDARDAGLGDADTELIVSAPAPGTWYILCYGALVPQPGGYAIQADLAPLLLTGVAPNRSVTLKDVRLRLVGAGFTAGTTVELVAADHTAYAPGDLQRDSFTQMTATYAAGTLPEGIYAVRVAIAGGDTVEWADALEIVGGEYATYRTLEVKAIGPAAVGYHMPAGFTIECTNHADVPMPAPPASTFAPLSTRTAGFPATAMSPKRGRPRSTRWPRSPSPTARIVTSPTTARAGSQARAARGTPSA